MTIKENKARCKKCDTVIVSTHVHDYVRCPCGAIAVDGGREYLRRAGKPEDVEELSTFHTAPPPPNTPEGWLEGIDRLITALLERRRQR